MSLVIQQQGVIVAQAPAKIIISGEHAVVYNHTAVSCAIKKYTSVSVAQNNLNALIVKDQLFTFQALRGLYVNVKKNYQQYLNGKLLAANIFANHTQLLPVAIYEILQALNYDYSAGLTVTVTSSVPMGSGMGSSSALLAACLQAIAKHLEINLSLAATYTYAKNIENLQHGKSSGLDLYTALTGGILYKSGDFHHKLPFVGNNFYFVNTGQPLSSTGDCVSMVKTKLNDLNLLDEFKCITDFIAKALREQNIASLLPAIAANHKLLHNLGVVSNTVTRFINELQNLQTSAKICGAGTVVGQKNGIVLICTLEDNLARILSIVKKYGYHLECVEIDNYGTRII
jgi:mevalonate kinase